MTARVRLEGNGEEGVYFDPKHISFLNTGCTLLNLVVSEMADKGGWPLGRVVNIVGDKSTGKTLLAEEAMANFLRTYPKGKVYYRESEAAFDTAYAKALGLNTDKVDFGPDKEDSIWNTIEDVFEDLDAVLTKAEEAAKKNKAPPAILYIIDSLDALTSAAEMGRDIREGSYNLGKQKLLGELFRTLIRRIRKANMCLIFISQVRDRIGAMIRGKTYSRTGGKALDFYASIVIFLAELGKMYKTVGGVKRTTGIRVKVKCEKNKIVVPHATCVFTIRFRYGIDDELSSFDWLKEVNKLRAAGYDKMPDDLSVLTESDTKKLRADVERIWREIEQRFTPAKGKYAA